MRILRGLQIGVAIVIFTVATTFGYQHVVPNESSGHTKLFDTGRALLYGALMLLVPAVLRQISVGSPARGRRNPKPLKNGNDIATAPRLLECIRNRRSVFPRSYVDRPVSPETMGQLLEASMWAPYHGSVPIGREAMVDMQLRTLDYYDKHWRDVGWADGKHGTESEYKAWRQMTE
eukprot:CAMPEP_0206292164 /NCGR_PEP_ID=MMETSP0106_2-20121207/3489_1 /ASSEMBLY_ACC=CAM_ASM_000206 /TAXON_ID=81532 /ORGANISM="Acanthoeca-like sp., Strain 10tr" /LENGTH=175 /DNA_ID=CAMNT_0053722737 /DNA_START=149 /DNA_END=673 /DNA_ORIENTATION=-